MTWQQSLLGRTLPIIVLGIVWQQLSPAVLRLANVAAKEIPPWIRNPMAVKGPATKHSKIVRLGILGAARIAPQAVVWPAFKLSEVKIVAVAARDPKRAAAFAKRHGIPQVHNSYQELIEDADIDAIYNPLPNGYHAYWTIQALRHGKHVLCEKPMASNSQEAQQMQQEALKHNLILAEAFHYRFHPLMDKVKELVRKFTPEIQHVRAEMEVPFFVIRGHDAKLNVRGQYPELAGGAFMDCGCYLVNFVRAILGKEPTKATADMTEAYPGVDSRAQARLEFDGSDASADIVASFRGGWLPNQFAEVRGSNGNRIRISNYVLPFLYNRITVLDAHGKTVSSEQVFGEQSPLTSTYDYQLDIFVRAVMGDTSALSRLQKNAGAEEAVRNMAAIDMVYRAAGLQPRKGIKI